MIRLALVAILLAGCVTPRRTTTKAEIKCYSGGELIFEGVTEYEGRPTGPIGRGFRFWHDGELVEVTGDCVVRYDLRTEPIEEPKKRRRRRKAGGDDPYDVL